MGLGIDILDVHFKATDGLPLCWELAEVSVFDATWKKADVTCPDCQEILEEE